MSDEYEYWRSALKAAAGEGEWPPIHPDDPQPGFYRMRRGKGGRWLPVAIWHSAQEGRLLATVDGKLADDPAELWSWVADRPVNYEDYQHRIEHGHWPGEIGDATPPVPGPGHNLPADPAEALMLEIEQEIDAALSWLELHQERIEQSAEADQAEELINRLRKLSRKADKLRKEEKQPHLDAARAVDDRWRPAIQRPKQVIEQLRKVLTTWLRAQKEAARRQAEEKLKAGALEASANPATSGLSGRKVALRRRKVAVIEDYQAALKHFADHPDVRTLVQRLANAAVRAGEEVPGVKVKIEEIAA